MGPAGPSGVLDPMLGSKPWTFAGVAVHWPALRHGSGFDVGVAEESRKEPPRIASAAGDPCQIVHASATEGATTAGALAIDERHEGRESPCVVKDSPQFAEPGRAPR